MGDKKTGTVIVGSQATPIPLGATGGGTDVGTYTHGEGKKALSVKAVDPVNGVAYLDAIITITQPDDDTIVATNTTGGALNAILIAEFEISTPQLSAEVAAAAVVLS
jgi:hypothetical protein